jgi:pyruvate dehydrogenase E2 component (dihydrolipoamide acetyltransferase)
MCRGIKYNKNVNVAMAVAIDGGLITPTIINAQELDLFSISRTWKELVDKAKSKKLTPAEYSSGALHKDFFCDLPIPHPASLHTAGTFTISNLGMFGVQQVRLR